MVLGLPPVLPSSSTCKFQQTFFNNEKKNVSIEDGPSTIGEHEIHIWAFVIDPTAEVPSKDDVSPEEWQRAARFHKESDHRFYLMERGLRRRLLAHYLNIDPCRLQISRTSTGKPFFTQPQDQWLRFNIAHSGCRVLYALARDREIGVDIEMHDDNFLSPEILRTLKNATPAERSAVFFSQWTRMEAQVKMTGEGLSHTKHSALGRSELYDLALGPDCSGAVAIERRPAVQSTDNALYLFHGRI